MQRLERKDMRGNKQLVSTILANFATGRFLSEYKVSLQEVNALIHPAGLSNPLRITTAYGYSLCRAKIYMLPTTLASQPQVIQTRDCNCHTQGCQHV